VYLRSNLQELCAIISRKYDLLLQSNSLSKVEDDIAKFRKNKPGTQPFLFHVFLLQSPDEENDDDSKCTQQSENIENEEEFDHGQFARRSNAEPGQTPAVPPSMPLISAFFSVSRRSSVCANAWRRRRRAFRIARRRLRCIWLNLGDAESVVFLLIKLLNRTYFFSRAMCFCLSLCFNACSDLFRISNCLRSWRWRLQGVERQHQVFPV